MTVIRHILIGIALSMISAAASAQNDPTRNNEMQTVSHLQDFQVIEFRRYTVAAGERKHFATYFDSYFPEAFEQLGAMVFGQFLERDHPNGFTWVRGFKDINARPIINAAFYYGPLWKEHRAKLNAILPDSDNVLLLRPLRPSTGVSVLPAVDPVTEPDGAHGIVVAQILPLKKDMTLDYTKRAEVEFQRYRIEGVHAAGVLVSLDVPNNFPQLPIRTDGNWLVWLGVVEDEAKLPSLKSAMTKAEDALSRAGVVSGTSEVVIMDPTPRSRLRWMATSRTP